MGRRSAKDGPHGEEGNLAEMRRKLAHATAWGTTAELQATLEQAQRSGMHGPEVHCARDRLLTLEAKDMRDHAISMVDEAIAADDWWMLQAAMATAAGAGLPPSELSRLQEAMRTHKRVKDAVHSLRRAADGNDTSELRQAIELAMVEHVSEREVQRARETLRVLEARQRAKQQADAARRKAQQEADAARQRQQQEADAIRQRALQKAEEIRRVRQQQLQQAAETKCTKTLRDAIAAVESTHSQDPCTQKDLDAARAELRSQALEKMHSLYEAHDADGLSVAIEEGFLCGVEEAELHAWSVKLPTLRVHNSHRQKLQRAVQVGARDELILVVSEAETAGLGDADLRPAREALGVFYAREVQDQTQTTVAEKLQAAALSEDVDEVTAAVSMADNLGLRGAESAHARERLRSLRARSSATRELREAVDSADVYRLRAAISTAKGGDVSEAELAWAREALGTLSAQAHARRALEAASASQDPNTLRLAIEQARGAGVPSKQIGAAEADLHCAATTHVDDDLRAAMAADDVERLRRAAGAAAHAGVAARDVDAAWAQVRVLEWRTWSRRELQSAAASGDSARLQAAIDDARAAGVAESELRPAVADLDAWVRRRQVQQELQLARAGGNAQALRVALDAAVAAGVTGGIVDMADAELRGREQGSSRRPPPPTAAPPPPPPPPPSGPPPQPESDALDEPEATTSTTPPASGAKCSGHRARCRVQFVDDPYNIPIETPLKVHQPAY